MNITAAPEAQAERQHATSPPGPKAKCRQKPMKLYMGNNETLF
jgi:hypothetical protein